ncbi:MAG: saccharopine dehydrogenase NADP-binding domain-containing protein [Rhodobacteraceae bacterium]|nr:saccharopine dehydrogenase NADP-binding domain-containing protein [Paracoccaceae bacterium]
MKTVLILGATGLFGGHLARQLIETGRFDVVCAGRTEATLKSFTSAHGGRYIAFSRSAPEAALTTIKPFAVVDAAGPFQSYNSYAFAHACLMAGAHYLDIADAPDFVQNITSLDGLAKANGLTAISGASTTPALTSAVLTSFNMLQIDTIETTILPGNQTPRGLSVMRAILGQVGQPMQLWEGGAWHPARGWSRLSHTALQVGNTQLKPRPASLVNTPDALLAAHFNASAVLPRAGLELGLFHHALRLARFLPFPLGRLTKPAHRIAGWAQSFGSDLGGMRVRATGGGLTKTWDLIASDGHGPKIPIQPAAILLDHLANGQAATGARSCIAEIPLAELTAAMARFGAISETRST